MARHRALAAFRIAGAYPGAITERGPDFRSVRSEGPGPSRRVLVARSPGDPGGPGRYGLPFSFDDDWTDEGWRVGETHRILRHPGLPHSDETPDLALGRDAERAGEFLGRVFLPRVGRVDRAHYARAIGRAGLPIATWSRFGRIVGSVTLTRVMGTVAVHALSVAPEARGKGLGTRILDWSLAYANGPTLLTATPEMAPWYVGRGFEEVGELRYWVS